MCLARGVTSSTAAGLFDTMDFCGCPVRSEIDGSRDGSPTFFEVPLSSTKCPMPPRGVRTMQNYPVLQPVQFQFPTWAESDDSQVLHLGLCSRELCSLP